MYYQIKLIPKLKIYVTEPGHSGSFFHLSHSGSINKRLVVQVHPGKNSRPFLKTNLNKKGWGE
jgi:hypothetical protein